MGPQDLLFRLDGLQLTEIAGHCCFFASVIQDQGPAAHNRRAIRSRLRIAMCHALRRRAKGPISARLSQTRGHWRPPFCCSKHQRSMDCALKRRSPSPPTRNAGILCYFRRRVPVIPASSPTPLRDQFRSVQFLYVRALDPTQLRSALALAIASAGAHRKPVPNSRRRGAW
jgi:hypothetical protein